MESLVERFTEASRDFPERVEDRGSVWPMDARLPTYRSFGLSSAKGRLQYYALFIEMDPFDRYRPDDLYRVIDLDAGTDMDKEKAPAFLEDFLARLQ